MSDETYAYLGEIFEWDQSKAKRNWLRHKVLFTEAATVFFDKSFMVFADDDHSIAEQRYTVLGRSAMQRTLFVVHVERGERIRIISARTATPRERGVYEAELGR